MLQSIVMKLHTSVTQIIFLSHTRMEILKLRVKFYLFFFIHFQTADTEGCHTLMLRSAFSDDTLTATDNMLRASRPMHSEGVDDLSGAVSDW